MRDRMITTKRLSILWYRTADRFWFSPTIEHRFVAVAIGRRCLSIRWLAR